MISVGDKGVASFRITDLQYDCVTERINAQVDSQQDEIK